MKVSEQWLREWIVTSKDTQAISALLTMGGLEVDQIIPVAGQFTGVQVAQVLETRPHPEADRLTLCQVNTGEGDAIQVVCGAQNVRAGLKVALATVGAALPNGLKIKAAKLRGEPSSGMLCAAQELGMDVRADGIMELPLDAPVGEDLRTYLGLDDQVFDIELTPNRGDCLSIQGVARELGAKLNLPIQFPEITAAKIESNASLQVQVELPDACPIYAGRVIENVNTNAQTPLWMQERLRRADIRPLHPVVDVTQYVMLELGQPMHAFDLSQIEGGIVVRQSQKGETLKLLDDQTITLSDSLIIADTKKPLALAGVMGGMQSAVNEGTKNVFLESAFFTPDTLAGEARRYGLSTDAAYRFERGVDPSLPLKALERATALIQQIAGGQAGEVLCVKQACTQLEPKTILFRPAQYEKRLGVSMSEETMTQILTDLGMAIEKQTATDWTVTVPSYRFDLLIEADILEELIRLSGYDTLPSSETISTLRAGKTHPIEQLESKAAFFLKDAGYRETISYSFVDPSLQALLFPEQAGLNLTNPISPELSQMRVSLWPGLIASMLYNFNRQQTRAMLFERGRVFRASDKNWVETPMIAGLLAGQMASPSCHEKQRDFDFYDLKGDLEAFFHAMSLPKVRFEAQAHSALHPGQSCAIYIDDVCIGHLGALHPQLMQALDITHNVFLFECALDTFTRSSPRMKYRSISKYPKIRRDLALLVDEQLPFYALKETIESASQSSFLKDIQVFDVYQGQGVPEGKKSIALALTLQCEDKTLDEQTVQAYLTQVIAALKQNNGAVLRDGS